MTRVLSVLVAGATGRMGQMVCQVVRESATAEVGGLLAYVGHTKLGTTCAPEGLPLQGTFVEAAVGCDVVIDFSLPKGCTAHAVAAAECGLPIVIGTTGLSAQHQASLTQAAQKVAVFWAPNMSLGIALLQRLVREAAAQLPEDFDIEVLDTHHRNKIDNPSGTALALGQAAAAGRGVVHDDHALYQRPRSTDVRDARTIGYAVRRGGGVVGDHEVLFAGTYEQLSFGHHALSRELFAAGALRAAQWLCTQPPGLYGMDDLLDIPLLQGE